MAFFNSKNVVVKLISPTQVLQLDTPTTLSFYIVEPLQEVLLNTVAYRVMKQSGRDLVELQAWSSDLPVQRDGVFTLDTTIVTNTVATTDKLVYEFKVIDVDGIESFHQVKDFSLTT